MSKLKGVKKKPHVVVRRWKHNPKGFQAIEAFPSKKEANEFIASLYPLDRAGLLVEKWD